MIIDCAYADSVVIVIEIYNKYTVEGYLAYCIKIHEIHEARQPGCPGGTLEPLSSTDNSIASPGGTGDMCNVPN